MRFRIMGNQLYVNPVGSAATLYTNTIAFEYVSKFWCTSTGGTTGTQSLFAADSDVAVIPEDILTLSLKWRYLRAKGLSYEKEEQDYEEKMDRTAGRAASSRNLPLNARAGSLRLLNSQNVPDTGFGS
jgi:hypothetical protein